MMVFDNMKPKNSYIRVVREIIRQGIELEKIKLKLKDNEELKNQQLAEIFNVIGSKNESISIFASKEHVKKGSTKREDIYFYLADDERTRIFYVEGKRLPKSRSASKEEYVKGVSTTKKPSGGIERYKLGLHGEPERLKSNGIIAYIENKTVSEWQEIINKSIKEQYPSDTRLIIIPKQTNEFISAHKCISVGGFIIMYHFWIDITKNK